MPVLGSNNLTLIDAVKRYGPDGNVMGFAQLLQQSNPIVQDAIWKEGNKETGHVLQMQTSLPTVGYRALNDGVAASKGTTRQVEEACAILEGRRITDLDVALLNGQDKAFLAGEDMMFIEAMNQRMATGWLYDNTTADTRQVLGFAPRLATLGQQVLNAGNSTAAQNTSIYLVGWGEQTVFGIYPRGSKAGLLVENLGRQSVLLSSGYMEAMVARFQWKCGVAVADPRYLVRIANINQLDVANQNNTQSTTANTNIIKLMSRALDRLPYRSMCKPVFYCNRTVYSGLKLMAFDRTSNVLGIEEGINSFGQKERELVFLGVPIRVLDKIETGTNGNELTAGGAVLT